MKHTPFTREKMTNEQDDNSGAIKQKNDCGCGKRVKLTASAKQKATHSKRVAQQFSKMSGCVRGSQHVKR